LSESIETLSSINKKDLIKTKKQVRKEKRIQEKLEQIWEDRQARVFWPSEMKLNESMRSIDRFHNVKDNRYYP